MAMDLKLAAMIATGSVLAAGSGFGASMALGQDGGEDQVTTTVNVGTGEQGPPGPAGPPGPQGPAGVDGGLVCKTGFVKGELVINHPGGQVTIWTCIKN
jgi:hypothetical protein